MRAEKVNGPLERAAYRESISKIGQSHPSNSEEQSQRILPINQAAERSVLGAVIEDDSILPGVIEAGLRVEDFSLSDHRRVFSAMLQLHQETKPVDAILVTERLGNRSQDAVLVASLIQGVIVHSDHVLHHVEILRNKSRLRQLLRVSEWIPRVVDECSDSDALIEQTIAKLERIARPEVRP